MSELMQRGGVIVAGGWKQTFVRQVDTIRHRSIECPILLSVMNHGPRGLQDLFCTVYSIPVLFFTLEWRQSIYLFGIEDRSKERSGSFKQHCFLDWFTFFIKNRFTVVV